MRVSKRTDIEAAAEQSAQNEPATKDDIERWARSMMKQSEDRIGQAEEKLRALSHAYAKLRHDLVPVFRMAKDQLEPLPNVPGGHYSTTSPNVSNFEPPSPLPGQTGRDCNTGNKKFGGSSHKNHSPPHPQSMQERKAVAPMSSNALPPVDSPSAIPQPSPTSPVPPSIPQTLANRSYQDNGMTSSSGGWNGNGYGQDARSFRTAPSHTPSTLSTASTTLAPTQLSIHGSPSTTSLRPPGSGGGSTIPATADGTAGPARSFRVPPDEPCHRILQAVLRKYDPNADPRHYALYIVYGDQERCVEMDERPVALLRDLDQSGFNPMFHLRKLSPQSDGGRTVGTAVASLPGGVL
jgi:protein STE50